MNQTFVIARDILVNIIENEVPFSLAIKNTFRKQKVDKEQSRNITALVGCELRHHIIFDYLLNKYFGKIPLAYSSGVLFLLSNLLFLKRFDKNDIYEFASTSLKEFDKSFENKKLDEFIKEIENSDSLIPNSIQQNSDEYFSFRFNTPLWIVRMWSKQYGKSVCIKMLKGNYKNTITTLAINPLLTNETEVLQSSSDFDKTIVPGILSYNGKVPVRKNAFFEKGQIFYEKMATKVIIDSLDIEPIKKIAIYCSFPNNIYLDLVSRFGVNVSIDLINSNTQSYFENKKMINLLGLPYINVFDETYKEIYTSLSNPVNLFFVLPRNSMLDLLRSTPDYFIKFKQNMLDDIIKEQKETLENASSRLEIDGNIVYMIPTLSMKEGHLLIKDFLIKHPEFVLEEERQFFPYESLDSCLYYANIKKIK